MKKILLIHKKQAIYFKSLLLMVVSLSLGSISYANDLKQVELSKLNVTVNLKDKSLEEILRTIGNQTKLEYLFHHSVKQDKNKKFSLNVKNCPIKKALDTLLKGSNYSYDIEGNRIIIINTPVSAGSSSSSSSSALPQKSTPTTRELRGRVVDAATKTPLVGATVLLSGSRGAITDENGAFVVTANERDQDVEVSFMGYRTMVSSVASKSMVIVELPRDVNVIDDVVVTGVFTRKQNTYTGATSTIKKEQLAKTGNLNLVQAIGMLDPSFNILVNDQAGSNPNVLPDIQMRGAASFSDMKNNYTSSPNQPLFVVDGFEQPIQKVMDMDMNRVASVTLLKDATAKAIYGSKGANGVVVIETIIPEQGALRVSYRGDLNIQTPVLRDYNRTNAAEKLEVERLAGSYDNIYPETHYKLQQKYQYLLREVQRGVNTDWLAQPTRVGVGHKHSLNVDGGDDAIRYGVNVGYNDIAGAMKGSSRSTFEGGFNIQYRYKSLLFRNNFSVTSNKSKESPYGNFEDYAKMNPYWRVRDEQGRLVERFDNYEGLEIAERNEPIYNPMINSTTNYKNESQYLDLTNNFYIEWAVTNDLRLTGRFSVNKNTSKTDLFYPSNYGTLDPNSPYNFRPIQPDAANEAYYKRGLYQKSQNDKFGITSDLTLNYSKQFGKNLLFTNVQYNISHSKALTDSYEGQGFADNAESIGQAKQFVENGRPVGFDATTNEIGVIASINYSYDSRYLLDANYRASGSSLFGSNNRWGHFWSVGAGWNVHNEAFMKNVKWIDLLKLRGSFGYTGSQNFSPYQAISTYSYFTDKTYDKVTGVYLMALSNPDLKWQQTEDTNYGFDFSFLKKFDISFDYYVKTTSNLLTPVPVVPSTGFGTFTENLGKSRNEGIELRVNYRVITDSKRDINLSVFGNLAHNKNKLIEINSALQAINDRIDKEQNGENNDGDGVSIFDRKKPRVEYAEGMSMSAIWGVRSLGINPYDGTEILVDKNGNRTTLWNADDKVVLGDALPKIQGTFGMNFDYKGISLNMNFSYRIGGQYYNQTLVDNVENADLNYNVDKRVFTDRWNPETPGVPAKYRQLKGGSIITNPTSRFVQDFNEFKMSSLNVGYDFRNCAFMKKTRALERLQLSFSMTDLFVLSTVKAERGINYPYAQSFIFSVSATF